jgi:hypothetical protein
LFRVSLIKQGNAWSVKVSIPKDVRHVFGKVAFKQALKTSDKIVANARAAPLVIKFQKQIVEAKERWSREFGPVVKVDQLVREMIQNDETKEPFARFQGQGCA